MRLGAARPRLRLVGVVLTLVMAVFVVRLLQVQAVDASSYAAKAAVNRWVTHEVTADRGTITDRDGVDLATTVDAYDITADPYLFTPAQTKVRDAPQQAAELLAPIVGGDATKIAQQLATPGSRYQIVARQQSPQAWNQIKDLKAAFAGKAATGKGADVLAGVFDEPHTKRVYPAGDLAAGVIGFVNSQGQGGGGLESMLDKQLAGRNGKIRYAQSDGRQVPTAGSQEQPAVPGTDVELTLDRDIQWAAQSAISQQVAKSRADRGYVIVQDSRTGQVLAMADAPGFNPNDLSHADPAALGNAAMQDAYEPGSVSKLMSMVGDHRHRHRHPHHPRHRARHPAARRPDLPRRRRPRHLVPHAQRRARQVQQHRHHPGQPASSAGPSSRPTACSTPTCASSASAAPPASASPARPPASWPSRRTGTPPSSTRSPSARACRSTPCRPPRSTRPSPTAASGSSPA